MNSKRLSLISALVLAAIGAFGASAAQAGTFCANSPDPACQTNHTDLATAVQDAVDDAEQSNGADTVLIGPGNYFSPIPMGLYSAGVDNSVTIIGSGPSTILKVTDPENPNITLDAGAGSSMSDLEIEINASDSGGSKEGLTVTNSFNGDPPTISNVTISANPNAKNLAGVVLYNGSDLEDSSVDVASSNYTVAVKADSGNPSEISRSFLSANTGAVQNSTGGELILDRTEIEATGRGVRNATGTVTINDSFIKLSSGDAQVALDASGNETFGDTHVNGSTIIANAGLGVQLDANTGDALTRLYLNSSVIAGSAQSIQLNTGSAGDVAAVDAVNSALNVDVVGQSGPGTFAFDQENVIDLSETSPGFADAGSGNYRLATGSALIDAGQADAPPEGALDYQGYPRACHGTASGLIRRDIGAFEFKTDPNDDCTYPEATIGVPSGAPADSTRTFPLTSSKPNSTFDCSIDGSPFQTCPAPFTTPTLPAGEHTLAVKARDAFGNLQQIPVSTSFTIEPATCETDPELCPPPTCETDPSLCPDPPDKTAPKVIGVKLAKKTKAKRIKVRFRANEAGSKFKCKLNGAKWRTCKSPWKTPKLRKGKNVIRIQVTDRAGNKSKVAVRTINRKVRRK